MYCPPFSGTTLLVASMIFATPKFSQAQSDWNCAEALKTFVESQDLAGAVMLVANKDTVLDIESIGWADIEAKQPMKENSVFWIASQSKPITATAFMMLVDEQKLSLDDSVAKYLPEFSNVMVAVESDAEHKLLRKPKSPMTIRQLLSHTSGLPFKSSLEEPTLDQFPLVARVRSYAMTPLESEPSSRYKYSNAGINTAARILEVVSGKPFEMFLDERLFEPLGMSDTSFWPSEQQVSRIAKSYSVWTGQMVPSYCRSPYS